MIRPIGLMILLMAPCLALATQSATGPVTPGEADILWERAQEQIKNKQVTEAIHSLERLTNRIPTHSRTIQAQRLLGELEMERGRAAEALEWFRVASSNLKGQGPMARELDLLRARAYLLVGKYSEALLTAEKLLRDADAKKIRWGVDAQIIKTRALFFLKQDKRAQSSLAAARRRTINDSLHPGTAALWLEVADLQSIESQCQRYPSAKVLNEEEVIDQAGRHAECVLRAREQREKIQSLPSPTDLDGKQALTDTEASWARVRRHFESFCDKPPLPPGRRSPQELEVYFSELKLALQPACSKAKTP